MAPWTEVPVRNTFVDFPDDDRIAADMAAARPMLACGAKALVPTTLRVDCYDAELFKYTRLPQSLASSAGWFPTKA